METLNKEDIKKLKGYMKELRHEAVWIGEDGGAACVAKTKEAAMRKFRALMRNDVGDIEAKEMSIDDVGIGWLHLPSADDKDEWGDEYMWFINHTKESPFEVWVYNP